MFQGPSLLVSIYIYILDLGGVFFLGPAEHQSTTGLLFASGMGGSPKIGHRT